MTQARPHLNIHKAIARSSVAAMVLIFSQLSTLARADDCPASKVVPGSVKGGPSANSGTTDTVISSIDLDALGTAFQGRKMRVRKLIVHPGGIVQWHSHEARPANIYIISGSITEYRSSCAVPINHGPGDVTAEFGGGLAHWWKNNTTKDTVLLSADLLPPDMKPAASM